MLVVRGGGICFCECGSRDVCMSREEEWSAFLAGGAKAAADRGGDVDNEREGRGTGGGEKEEEEEEEEAGGNF